jgi:hypothetical protein
MIQTGSLSPAEPIHARTVVTRHDAGYLERSAQALGYTAGKNGAYDLAQAQRTALHHRYSAFFIQRMIVTL